MSVINATPLLAAAGGDYQISRSVRLRSSASAWFNRTASGSGGNPFTFSCWLKRGSLATRQFFFAATNGTNNSGIGFDASDRLNVVNNSGSDNVSTAVYRDPSAWYHIVFNSNGTNVIVYVNGQQSFTFAASMVFFNTAVSHTIGRLGVSALHFDGYLTEINFIDGQALTPSSFGETDSITGVWKPKKYAGTYGTNGFYLNFSDNSSNTATTIGKDNSGNGNNWTPNNISVTSGVTYDSMLDVPTLYADGGNGRGNYAVLNPAYAENGITVGALSQGNLVHTGAAADRYSYSTITILSGSYYYEVTSNSATGVRSVQCRVVGASTTQYLSNGQIYVNNTLISTYSTWTTNDVIGVAVNRDSNTIAFYKNNALIYTATGVAAGEIYAGLYTATTDSLNINFGQRPFAYTPPTGFKALNTQNLPEPTIKKGNQYFNTVLYTGNGTGQTVSGVGFQPNFVWGKSRSNIRNHNLYDAVRGAGNMLLTNGTNAELTGGELSAFTSDGFTLGSNVYQMNASGDSMVAWNWKESPSAGFDIVTYTGNGAGGVNISHSLGVAPKMMIVKSRSLGTQEWAVYHAALGATKALYLNTTAAALTSSAYWWDVSPASSVFTVGNGGVVNSNGATYVAYLFAEVAGFSKFGSYTGNGSADGPFVFCGFRPRYVMIKRSDSTGSWLLIDTARNPINNAPNYLQAESSAVEGTDNTIDILSNGFKLRLTSAAENASGGTYIFMAFAESPTKYALAR